MRDFEKPNSKASHPYAWLWEPLENDPTFILKSMFSAKAAYLDGKLHFTLADDGVTATELSASRAPAGSE